MVRASSDRTEI